MEPSKTLNEVSQIKNATITLYWSTTSYATSVANTTAKPWNWATFDPAAVGKMLAPRFANPIPVNVISMG